MKLRASLSLIVLVAASVMGSTYISWPGADPVESLPIANIPVASYFPLHYVVGPNSEQSLVTWFEQQDGRQGLQLARKPEGSTWQTTTLETGDEDAWFPSLAYSGTQLLTTWVQGEYHPPEPYVAPLGAVMYQEVGGVQAQTVFTPAYGFAAPYMAVGPARLHMVFASVPVDEARIQANLYYAARDFSEPAWSMPTKLITYTQVVSYTNTGNVAYPRLALSQDGGSVHIVWQQRIGRSGGVPFESIWYISGTVQTEGVAWESPMRVSPETQTLAQRPQVVVDNAGRAHIIWSEKITGGGGQNIYYRHWADGAWSEVIRLNGEPFKVTAQAPRDATPVLDVRGNTVCVAWYGYYDTWAEAREEIALSCSQNGGAMWQPILNVSDQENSPEPEELISIFPFVHLMGSGQVHLAWVEFRSDDKLSSEGLFYRSGPDFIYQGFLPLVKRGS